MKPIQKIKGIIAPLLIDNIDTDVIIPQTELVTIKKTGLGKGLFARWRYDTDRNEYQDFILNQTPFRSTKILLAGKNFGCGSSREHAVWSLMDFGIECVIATSFGEIFYHNALKNGLLVAMITEIDFSLLKAACESSTLEARVDILERKIVVANLVIPFTLSEHEQKNLLLGRDEIDETLLHQKSVRAFQIQDHINRPWIYNYV